MPANHDTHDKEGRNFSSLSLDAARIVDEICDYFEHQLCIQGRPSIEELLATVAEPERSALLHELLMLELETYLVRDTIPNRSSYLIRFPDHAKSVHAVFDALFPQQIREETEVPFPKIPKYRVLRLISQGGMGKVFEALQTTLGKRVALKVLHSDLSFDVESEARFEKEIKVIGTLAHPNIVEARDAGKAEGVHFLVMEYVVGLDLAEIVQRLGPLPVADACEICRQVAQALQYAANYGVIHRDIKPKNILVGHPDASQESCLVKVVDYGLAVIRSHSALRHPGQRNAQVVGTFAYMAPEQFWEGDSDIRSDIYSLGCTLYCLLMGRPPFSLPQYDGFEKIMEAHRSTPVNRLRTLRPDVPPDLEEAVLRMLAKERKDRFQKASEVVAMLTRFTEGHNLEEVLTHAESFTPFPSKETPPTSPEPALERTEARPKVDQFQDTAHFDGPLPKAVITTPKPEPATPEPKAATTTLPQNKQAKENEPLSRRQLFYYALAGGLAVVGGAYLIRKLSGGQTIDLLAQIDVDRDAIDGRWTREGTSIRSPDAPLARLKLMDSPSASYRLSIEAERESGGRLVLGLVWRGRQAIIILDEATIGSSGNPISPEEGEQLAKTFQFEQGRPHTYTCIVRPEGMMVAYEDQIRFSSLKEDPSTSEETAKWQTADPNMLFVGTHYSIYRFRQILYTHD